MGSPVDDALDRIDLAVRHALGNHHAEYAGLVDAADIATRQKAAA